MKEELIQKIQIELLNKLKMSDVRFVIDIIRMQLNEFELVSKTTDLVIYDRSEDLSIINKFFVAKTIEGLSKRSLDFYKVILSNFFKRIKNIEIKDMTTDTIRYYLSIRSQVDKISPVSQNNERRVLSSFFSFLADEDIIDKNPMRKIKHIKSPKRIKEAFTEYEIEALRNNCVSLRDKAIIEFLYSTGVRISECTQLTKRDINFQESTVKVIGKGNKERYVYLNAKAKFTLNEYINSRKDKKPGLFVADKKPNNSIGISAIANSLREIGKRAGVDNVHPHRFRRTAATIALNRGMPIEQVKELLGHESIETTTIYAISDRENVKLSHRKFLN